MENVVLATFAEEAKSFEVLANIKNQQTDFNIPSAGVLVKEDNKVSVKDFFNFDDKYDSWAVGGLLVGYWEA